MNIIKNNEYDIAVCGGGFAGISAALAAARHGKRVVLFEKEYMLGGLGTAGLITIYLPLCDGYGHQVSFGIAEDKWDLMSFPAPSLSVSTITGVFSPSTRNSDSFSFFLNIPKPSVVSTVA